ncbi:unnamed protein product [Amoebophrya sp. A25]|nr:unnamed protein product [Amoebophrya sp. A25]|eukprot:GSA25T00005349001.1
MATRYITAMGQMNNLNAYGEGKQLLHHELTADSGVKAELFADYLRQVCRTYTGAQSTTIGVVEAPASLSVYRKRALHRSHVLPDELNDLFKMLSSRPRSKNRC